MPGYLVFWGDLRAEPAAALIEAVTQAGREAWVWGVKTDEVAVLARAAQPLSVHWLPDHQSLVIGDIWTRGADTSPDLDRLLAHPSALAQARALCAGVWGRYVALLRDRAGPAIFRDPTGGLEALTWRLRGVTVVASGLPPDLIGLIAPPLTLDWDAIGQYLAAPASLSGPLALRGVSAIAAGELLSHGDGGQTRTTLWTPAAFVETEPEPPHLVQGRLVRLVDACVASWVRDRGPLLAEVSGGLDSAIVATALARNAQADVVQWLNYYGQGAESDERVFAQALGQLYGLPITCVAKPARSIDAEGLAGNARSVRPSLMGLDYLRDDDVAERCAELGDRAIFTGQGGDAIFAQRLTPLALIDHARRHGARGLGPTVLRDLADWTGSSAWSVLSQALRGVRGGAGTRAPVGPSFLTDAARSAPIELHPWLSDLEDVAPGKRQQIERLVQSQLVTGDCRRAREVDLIHPLLSQPLVEYSLGVPVDVLTQLKRDRSLARKAFASRLPEALVHRRSKGDMTAHYGRWVSASLPFLRSFLLEGRLAAQGIIDRSRLEAMLTREQLAWGADYVAILWASVLEAWIANWEATCRDLAARR